MKKLIVAMSIALTAALSGAAQFSWQTATDGTGKLYYGTTAIGTGVDVYLFDAAVVSQEACIKAIVEDKSSLSSLTSVKTAQTNVSKIPYTEFDYGTKNQTYSFYWAAVKDNDVYISTLFVDKPCPETGTTELIWTDANDTSNGKLPVEFAKGGGNTYAAGWYTAAPEPTSGLMLLLGIGLMALKRKRN